ncbi:hypothetical protein HB777_24025 [Mesorhizobium loti]|nr:hypothetical protein HB777_24025 [Mesorhizobium loti]
MANIKNLPDAIVKEPEPAGVEIQRKSSGAKDASQAPVSPKTAGAPPKSKSLLADPFLARQSEARPVAGKTPRPTDRPGE